MADVLTVGTFGKKMDTFKPCNINGALACDISCDKDGWRLLYLAHRGGADISQMPKDMQEAIMETATPKEVGMAGISDAEKVINLRASNKIYRDQVRDLLEENGRLRLELLRAATSPLPSVLPASDLPSRDRMAWELFAKYVSKANGTTEAYAGVCYLMADKFMNEATRQREAKK